jgi:hypothetical protein
MFTYFVYLKDVSDFSKGSTIYDKLQINTGPSF